MGPPPHPHLPSLCCQHVGSVLCSQSTFLNKPDCFPVFLYKTLNIHRAITLNGILWQSFFSTHWLLFFGTCPTTGILQKLGIYLTLSPIGVVPNQVRGREWKQKFGACCWGQEISWRQQGKTSCFFCLKESVRMKGQTEVDTRSGSKGKWKPPDTCMSAFLLPSSPSLRTAFRTSIFLGQKQGARSGDILKAILAL